MTTLLTAAALFFSTECEKHLVLINPQVLEKETDQSLELIRWESSERFTKYGHPLDQVTMRMVDHEIFTRMAIRGE